MRRSKGYFSLLEVIVFIAAVALAVIVVLSYVSTDTRAAELCRHPKFHAGEIVLLKLSKAHAQVMWVYRPKAIPENVCLYEVRTTGLIVNDSHIMYEFELEPYHGNKP